MEKKKQSGRETEETELQEYILHTVLLAAGAAVLMACLKRATFVMVFLMEQWRAWVFLVLNLILLAIFFTSISSTSNIQNQQCNNSNGSSNTDGRGAEVVKNIERKKKRREDYRCPSAQVVEEEVKECDENEAEWFECNAEEVPSLSKEALNERVEAFIVMFRQHLVSDARN